MNKKPIIAIDIDDVLFDSAGHMLGHYNDLYGTALNLTHYYSKDIEVLGVDDYAVAADRFDKYIHSEAFSAHPPITRAQEALGRLKERFEFIAITSRPDTLTEATAAILSQHFEGVISEVIHTTFIMGANEQQRGTKISKAEVCNRINAVCMVEDHLRHAEPIAEAGIDVLLLDKPWNQADVLHPNIQRVSSWKDIEKQLVNAYGTD